jgi:anaerobic ribonucleoside-triphosphate reductase activating protein
MTKLRIAKYVKDTEAEGPGRRFALWVQGCTLRCPGCCNPEMFSTTGGQLIDSREMADIIINTPGIEGVSILGGEPFQQAVAVAEVCRLVKQAGLSVMVYSGYTLDVLRKSGVRGARELLANIDILVDGRFMKDMPETRRRWIGSANQQIHFLTDRYNENDPRFYTNNTVEVRFINGEITINGWPQAADAFMG